MFGNWILQDPVESELNFQWFTTYAVAYRYLPKEEWQVSDTSDDFRYSGGDVASVYTATTSL